MQYFVFADYRLFCICVYLCKPFATHKFAASVTLSATQRGQCLSEDLTKVLRKGAGSCVGTRAMRPAFRRGRFCRRMSTSSSSVPMANTGLITGAVSGWWGFALLFSAVIAMHMKIENLNLTRKGLSQSRSS